MHGERHFPRQGDVACDLFALGEVCPAVVVDVFEGNLQHIGAFGVRRQQQLLPFHDELRALFRREVHQCPVVAGDGDAHFFPVVHGRGGALARIAQSGRGDEPAGHGEGCFRFKRSVPCGGDVRRHLVAARLGRRGVAVPGGAVVGGAAVAVRNFCPCGRAREHGTVGRLAVRPAFDGQADGAGRECALGDGETVGSAAALIVRRLGKGDGERVAADLRGRLAAAVAFARVAHGGDGIAHGSGRHGVAVGAFAERPAFDGYGHMQRRPRHGKGSARTAAEVIFRFGDGDGEGIAARLGGSLPAAVCRARVGGAAVHGLDGAAARVARHGVAVGALAVRPAMDSDGGRDGRLGDGDGHLGVRRLVVAAHRGVDGDGFAVALGNRGKSIVGIDERRFAVAERRAALDALQRARVGVLRLHAGNVDERLRPPDDHFDGDISVGNVVALRVDAHADGIAARVDGSLRRGVCGARVVLPFIPKGDARGDCDLAAAHFFGDEHRRLGRAAVHEVGGERYRELDRPLADGIGAADEGEGVVFRPLARDGDVDVVCARGRAGNAREGDLYPVCRLVCGKHFCRLRRSEGIGERLLRRTQRRGNVVRGDGNGQFGDGYLRRGVGKFVVFQLCTDDGCKGIGTEVPQRLRADGQGDLFAADADKRGLHGSALILSVIGEGGLPPVHRCRELAHGVLFLRARDIAAREHIVCKVDRSAALIACARDGKGVFARVDHFIRAFEGEVDMAVARADEVRPDVAAVVLLIVGEVVFRPADGDGIRLDDERARQFVSGLAARKGVVCACGEGCGHGVGARVRFAFAQRIGDRARRAQRAAADAAARSGAAAYGEHQAVRLPVVGEGHIRKGEAAHVVDARLYGKFMILGICGGEVVAGGLGAHAVVARVPYAARELDPAAAFVLDFKQIGDIDGDLGAADGSDGTARRDACRRLAPMGDADLRQADGDIPGLRRDDVPGAVRRHVAVARRARLPQIVGVADDEGDAVAAHFRAALRRDGIIEQVIRAARAGKAGILFGERLRLPGIRQVVDLDERGVDEHGTDLVGIRNIARQHIVAALQRYGDGIAARVHRVRQCAVRGPAVVGGAGIGVEEVEHIDRFACDQAGNGGHRCGVERIVSEGHAGAVKARDRNFFGNDLQRARLDAGHVVVLQILRARHRDDIAADVPCARRIAVCIQQSKAHVVFPIGLIVFFDEVVAQVVAVYAVHGDLAEAVFGRCRPLTVISMRSARLPYDDVDGELVDIEGLAEGAGQRIVFGVFIARLKALHREGVAAFLIVFELLHADLQLVDAAAEAVVRLDDVKLIFTVIGIMPLHRPGDTRNDGFVDGVLLRERVAARGEGIVVRMAARQRKGRRDGMFARVRAVACGHFVTDEAHAARQVVDIFEARILHLPVVDVFADGELDIIYIVMNIKLRLCNGPGEAGISIGIFAVVAVARRPLIVLRVLQADADPILARVGCLQIRNVVCIIIRRPVCRPGKAHHFRIEAD